MEMNALPKYDFSDNPTKCCPRFKSEGWDEQELHFKDKLFTKVKTRSLFHIPINMRSVFSKVQTAMEKAHAINENNLIILSHDASAWRSKHYFSSDKDIPGQNMVHLSGDYLTKVFEGPYRNVPKWEKEMKTFVENKGKQMKRMYFFYRSAPSVRKFMVKILSLQSLKFIN